ncbi:MAG: sugar phosphate isomerase/epimerase [Oscillospiraceae bacterium]|nr:sugar phosphate isomerase/epimerase [Oscillospiraceae bacterium]
MKKEQIYISTTASDASDVVRQWGLGIEIAEYCTAWNMDDEFAQTDAAVQEKLAGITRRVLHAPFNELFPCAIDRKARELAAYRHRQAITLAKQYGAAKVIIHGGYNPWIYYPVWYVGESIKFWQEFLKEDPGVQIVLENVLEEEPGMLLDIVKGVDNPRLRLCLDVGHVNAYSKVSVLKWLKAWAPYLSHFHIYNNDGSWDTHSALDCGSIPMRELLAQAESLCPNATFTLELMEAEPSVRWLLEEGLWN